MIITQNDLINVSHEVTKIDGSNDGIWFFGNRLEIENELIIGLSPTNYHCFIICGNIEFHPRFSINPCKLKPAKFDNIRAALFIRIQNIPKEDLRNFQEYLTTIKNKRTPTCHQGLLQIFEKGIGISIPQHSIINTTPKSFLKGMFTKGFIDKNQNALQIQVYTTRNKSLERIHTDINNLSWKFGWVFTLSNIYYRWLKIIRPKVLVR
jgi:hypothetical protein